MPRRAHQGRLLTPADDQPRVAVVTGAASGVGAVYARRLADLGYDVAVCDLDASDATVADVRAAGRRAIGVRADASLADDVTAFGAAVREELGPVRVLVNNVGISPYTPFEEITIDEWRKVMAVNLDSLFLMTRAFVDDMKAAGWGRIVNVTTALAWDAAGRNVVHYATSKMGVLGFTRTLASELGPDGITVNAICPGIVRTEALEARLPPERWDQYIDRQAVKRIAEPSDMLAALSMLVSEDAGQITAVNLPVHGGRVWM